MNRKHQLGAQTLGGRVMLAMLTAVGSLWLLAEPARSQGASPPSPLKQGGDCLQKGHFQEAIVFLTQAIASGLRGEEKIKAHRDRALAHIGFVRDFSRTAGSWAEAKSNYEGAQDDAKRFAVLRQYPWLGFVLAEEDFATILKFYPGSPSYQGEILQPVLENYWDSEKVRQVLEVARERVAGETGQLEITVEDKEGNPIPNARVTVTDFQAASGIPGRHLFFDCEGRTQEDGTWSAEEVPVGPYLVRADAPGFQRPDENGDGSPDSAWPQVEVRARQLRPVPIRLSRIGKPPPRVEVRARQLRPVPIRLSRTGKPPPRIAPEPVFPEGETLLTSTNSPTPVSQEYDQGSSASITIQVRQTQEVRVHSNQIRQTQEVRVHSNQIRQTQEVRVHSNQIRQTQEVRVHRNSESPPNQGNFEFEYSLVQQGKPAEAEEAYRTALELDPDELEPNHDDGHQRMDDVLFRQGKVVEARAPYRKTLAALQQACQREPKKAQNHNSLAWFLLTVLVESLRDAPTALHHARIAHELAPDEANFTNTLGVALYRCGQYTEAVAVLQAARRVRKENPEDLYPLAACFACLSQGKEAQDHWDKAIQSDPHHLFRTEVEALLEERLILPKNRKLNRVLKVLLGLEPPHGLSSN